MLDNYKGLGEWGRAHNTQLATKTDLISASFEVSYFKVKAPGKGMKLKFMSLLLNKKRTSRYVTSVTLFTERKGKSFSLEYTPTF